MNCKIDRRIVLIFLLCDLRSRKIVRFLISFTVDNNRNNPEVVIRFRIYYYIQGFIDSPMWSKWSKIIYFV